MKESYRVAEKILNIVAGDFYRNGFTVSYHPGFGEKYSSFSDAEKAEVFSYLKERQAFSKVFSRKRKPPATGQELLEELIRTLKHKLIDGKENFRRLYLVERSP